MNQAAQDKLRELRQHLAELEPLPWQPVEAWVARATPLIRQFYPNHLKEFERVTANPFPLPPPMFSRVTYDGVEEDNFAEAGAIHRETIAAYAPPAKAKILAFVDGLLDLPPVAAGPTGEVVGARIGGLTEDAGRILEWLREQYVAAGYPNHRVWTFKAYPEHRAVFAELRAHGYIQPFGAGNVEWRLTDFGQHMILQPPEPSGDFTVNIHHHHGDTHMGSDFKTNIIGSTVGAVAVGNHAVATGTVHVHQGPLTQAQHREHIKAAKKALADDEERLDAARHAALEQFLKDAREVPVESREIAEVQAEMDAILERVWAEHDGKALPQGLQVKQALAQNPAMVGVTKKLRGA